MEEGFDDELVLSLDWAAANRCSCCQRQIHELVASFLTFNPGGRLEDSVRKDGLKGRDGCASEISVWWVYIT